MTSTTPRCVELFPGFIVAGRAGRSRSMPSGRPRPGMLSWAALSLTAALLAGSGAEAGLVTLDICPAGTTSNLNVFGTGTALVSGTTVATWPTNRTAYRDYQFKLQTISGTTSFDDFAVQLSASRRNSNTVSNTLRATLWTGTIAPNPILADALVTATIPNSSVSSSGYSSILLTGLTFPSQTISTAPSTFFFRIWAEGDGSNSGFQTKIVNTRLELPLVTLAETVPGDIDGYIGVDEDQDGDFNPAEPGNDYYDFISYTTAVPEIDPQGFAGVAAFVTAALGWLERRRNP